MAEHTVKSHSDTLAPMQTRSAEGTIAIEASPERVWRALTDARELERWFPLDARVEPGEGGSIWMSWRNEFDGEMRIRVWDPPAHLQTAWSFHEADAPGQVTDYLIGANETGRTVLRAVTSGFPMDPSWDGWVDGTTRGWAFELRSLKHYLEHHEGEPRHVVYRRRRVRQSVEEAWRMLQADPDVARWLALGEAFERASDGQHAAVLPAPHDDLFRLSTEPGAPGADQRDVVVFLSAWGDAERRVMKLDAEWTELLERVFPEGTTP